jgi:hypothetical protein
MFRIVTYFTLFCFLILSAVAQEKTITAETKIQRVIVFLSGAQIERTAQVAIPEGTSLVLFKGLSPQIEEQSIQVKGIGAFTIMSVNKQSNFLEEQRASERQQNLRDRIVDLTDKREIEQNVIAILKKEEDMLASNQNIGSGGAGLDLTKLKQALDFQKARLTENKVKQLATQKEIKKLSEQIQKVENQLKEEAGGGKNNTIDIAVKISSKSALNGAFTISYLVKSAGWYPSYDLRATDVNRPIDLVYRANISQQSGEDWKNVNLVLSSGDPSLGAAKPTLLPYQLGYNVSYYRPSAAIGNVHGRITDTSGESLPGASIKVKGTSIGAVSNAEGNFSIQVPDPKSVLVFTYIGFETVEQAITNSQMNIQMKANNALENVVVVGYGSSAGSDIEGRSSGVRIRGVSSVKKSSIPIEVQSEQKQINVQFEITRPYSISSDGKQLTVEIAEHQLHADYRYHAIPKLSEAAYLTAAVAGINELNLLSGEASVFFDGAYLGRH